MELRFKCDQCAPNATNVTSPPGSGAGGNETAGNVTGNVTGNGTVGNETGGNVTLPNITGGFYSAVNYTLPSLCNYSANDNNTVCCSEQGSQRSVCYSFTNLNEFWDFSLSGACQDVWTVHQQCAAATGDADQCFRMRLFNQF
jgi:hypothetical protein